MGASCKSPTRPFRPLLSAAGTPASSCPTATSWTESQSWLSVQYMPSPCSGMCAYAVELTKGEGQFDGDEYGDRLTEPRTRLESPLFSGLDRFLVEAKCRVQRSNDFDLSDCA